MSEGKRISPNEAHEKMGQGYTYVDVRTEEEFAQGHPMGAFNVPVMLAGATGMAPNPDFGAVMAASFAPSAKIVVGCKAGGRSMRAAQILAQQGFTDVLDQRAGWDGARNEFGQVAETGWAGAGLPKESGAPEGRSYPNLKKRCAAKAGS
jgi:rhodanese-related sulfurtransferase